MRLLVDLVENNELEEGKILIHEMLRGIVMERFKDISSKFLLDEQGAAAGGGGSQQPPDPDEVAGTLEDPLIDPNMSREYFFKRFKHGNYEIILKKLGLGQNAPTVSYIDGVRYEVFTTPLQAEKETIRYIEDGSYEKALDKKKKEKEEKAKEAEKAEAAKKPPAPAPKPNAEETPKEEPEDKKKETNESLKIMSEVLLYGRPMVIDFNNGDSRVITIEEAKNALEIYDLLNNENRVKFVERLNSGEEIYLEMLDFLMDRVRKGII